MSEAKPLTAEEIADKKSIWERLAAELGVKPNSNAELTGRLLATIAALQREKENLSMLARRMLRVMSMNGLGDREVYLQAQKYLQSIGATGSILRDEDVQEQAAMRETEEK